MYKDQRVLQVILGKVDNQALQEILEILDHKVRLDRQVHPVLAAQLVRPDNLDPLDHLVQLETQDQMHHPHHKPKEVIQVHLAQLVSQDKVVLLVNRAQGVSQEVLDFKGHQGSKALTEISVPKDLQDLLGLKDLVVPSETSVLLDFEGIQASEEAQDRRDHKGNRDLKALLDQEVTQERLDNQVLLVEPVTLARLVLGATVDRLDHRVRLDLLVFWVIRDQPDPRVLQVLEEILELRELPVLLDLLVNQDH